MIGTLYIDSNNVAELSDVRNSVTNVVDEGATVEITICDQKGGEVQGQAWPVTLSHVSNGLYRATLDHDLVLVPNRYYTSKVTAIGSGGERGSWSCSVVAGYRRC